MRIDKIIKDCRIETERHTVETKKAKTDTVVWCEIRGASAYSTSKRLTDL
jgi:hypothetical protein